MTLSKLKNSVVTCIGVLTLGASTNGKNELMAGMDLDSAKFLRDVSSILQPSVSRSLPSIDIFSKKISDAPSRASDHCDALGLNTPSTSHQNPKVPRMSQLRQHHSVSTQKDAAMASASVSLSGGFPPEHTQVHSKTLMDKSNSAGIKVTKRQHSSKESNDESKRKKSQQQLLNVPKATHVVPIHAEDPQDQEPRCVYKNPSLEPLLSSMVENRKEHKDLGNWFNSVEKKDCPSNIYPCKRKRLIQPVYLKYDYKRLQVSLYPIDGTILTLAFLTFYSNLNSRVPSSLISTEMLRSLDDLDTKNLLSAHERLKKLELTEEMEIALQKTEELFNITREGQPSTPDSVIPSYKRVLLGAVQAGEKLRDYLKSLHPKQLPLHLYACSKVEYKNGKLYLCVPMNAEAIPILVFLTLLDFPNSDISPKDIQGFVFQENINSGIKKLEDFCKKNEFLKNERSDALQKTRKLFGQAGTSDSN